METITFDIEFSMPHIEADVLKQKQYAILTNTINQSRLAEFMLFEGPGMITFDDEDTKHWHPHVNLMDKYNRLKTNCLIYSLPTNPTNQGYYDKLVVYYTAGVKTPLYGYVLYNSTTNKSSHTFYIDDDYNDLLRCLNQTFNHLYDYTLYEHYGKKYDSIVGQNGMTMDDCPREDEYEIMSKERNSRIYDFSYAKNMIRI